MPKTSKTSKTTSGKPEVNVEEERHALTQKKFKVGDEVTATLGSGTRSGTIVSIDIPEDANKSPMIEFTRQNEKGETKTYRHRPTLVERD